MMGAVCGFQRETMQDSLDISPEELMRRFQAGGDPEVFEDIVSRYLKPALGVGRQLLGDKAQAEDAVQEAFLRVLRKRDHFESRQSFSGWFYTILRNVCRDLHRRRSRYQEAIQQVARRSEQKRKTAFSSDILTLFSSLRQSEREVLELRLRYDLNFRDIGVALGISEEAAKKRSQRGLRRLREKIRREKGVYRETAAIMIVS